MKKLIRILILFCILMLFLVGCDTAEEREQKESSNKIKADYVAKQYFEDDFEFDFSFYDGGGEFENSFYMYVYTDGVTINCIGITDNENGPGPYVYYDCILHQYSNGKYSLETWKDFINAENDK